jgi:hypothetical protein
LSSFKNEYRSNYRSLKLGSDARLYKGKEKTVTDFYSYDEPVYVPADGRVVQIVEGFESDVLGNREK